MVLPPSASHCSSESSSLEQQWSPCNGLCQPAQRCHTPRPCGYTFVLPRGKYLSVLWRVDVLSLATVVLLLVLLRLLPPQLATVLLALELAFGVITVPRRCHRFDTSLSDQRSAGSSSQADAGEDATLWLQAGEQVLKQLLDPSEGLLRSDDSWFLDWWADGISPSELGRSNVAQFLSYFAFSGRLTDEALNKLQQLSDTFIATLGLEVRSDHNPKATFVTHTQEPLKARYRPLTFYLLMEAVAGVSHLQLTARQGFRLAAKTLTATYYLRPAPLGAFAQPPLVFLHGIGLGLAPYTAFIRRMAAQHPDRTIIAVQYRHVSMRLTVHIPSATDVSDDVAAFLTSAGFTSAHIVAHSYGTLVASGLAKRHPALLAGLTLIDPVCFAMFLPHLVVNTLHFDAFSRGRRAQVKGGVPVPALSLRRLMKGLVLREMHCAAAMSRRLRWPEVNLWLSEVPANTSVYLSGLDNMIPVAEIHQLLTSPAAAARGVQVTYTPEHGHGAFLMHPELQQRIVRGCSVVVDSSTTGTAGTDQASPLAQALSPESSAASACGCDEVSALPPVAVEARVPRWRRRRLFRVQVQRPVSLAGSGVAEVTGGDPLQAGSAAAQLASAGPARRPAFRRPLLLRPLLLMQVLRTVPWGRPFKRRRTGTSHAAGAADTTASVAAAAAM